MTKKKIIILGGIIVLLGILGGILLLRSKDNKNSDALKFKEEYESLNNTVRETDGANYNNITIDKDNPIKYITVEEALDILDSDEAIIYIGANWCPWCRNAVPVLFDVFKDFNKDTIYYLNLDDDKSNYEVKDGTLTKTKDGSSDYYKLLDKLSSVLSDYTLTDSEGKEYNTNEKRIYMPFVIGVKNGEISSTHTGTVTLNEGQSKYDPLTDSQYEELYETYRKLLISVFGDTACNDEEACS